jgi:hypothetical protein
MQIRMSNGEVRLFEEQLNASKNYLEFGMGGSTKLAISKGINTISVESDQRWIEKVSQEISSIKSSSTLFKVYYANIGPTREWGIPSSDQPSPLWQNYYLGVWPTLSAEPNFVLVDGRFRAACAMACMLGCSSSVRIGIHDFQDGRAFRKNYERILEFADIFAKVETLLIVTTKRKIDRIKLLAALYSVRNDYF